MVGYRFRLGKDVWFTELVEGHAYAQREEPEEGMFSWESGKEEIKIQDDYFFVDLGNRGWLDFNPKDFTSEMVAMIFELNPNVATKEVQEAFWKAQADRPKE